jgi:hypothetical protein
MRYPRDIRETKVIKRFRRKKGALSSIAERYNKTRT